MITKPRSTLVFIDININNKAKKTQKMLKSLQIVSKLLYKYDNNQVCGYNSH